MSQDALMADNFLSHHGRRYRFFRSETYAAFALAAATTLALLWANFGGESYSHFWHTHAGISIGSLDLNFTLHEWVDEGLMTFFFFMVGLDVRRDLTLGELRNPRQAILPIAAAIGGLVVPALFFLGLTAGSGFEHAWGVVISTDTAFALGMLALIGPRNAPRLRAFLLAFAVIDDIGALSVIAIFYTEDLNVQALAFVALGLLAIWLLARRGVWQSFPYVVVGIFTWYAMYSSGIHATLAGVLIALLMPVYPVRREDADVANSIFDLYRQDPIPGAAQAVRETLVRAVPLNQRLSDFLPGYVNYLVVPLFALANAGIVITGDSFSAAMTSAVTWGVIGGLVLGKLVGVVLGAWVVQRLVPSSRVAGLDMPRIAGIAALSGMGFTISLLVAGMALDDPVAQDQARVGVLLASALALALATVIFRLGDRFAPLDPPAGDTLPRPLDDEDHLYGPKNAPVQLVLYTEYTPEKVSKFAGALWQSYGELGNDPRISYSLRHNVTTELGTYVALALEAAEAQGLFRDFHTHISRDAEEVLEFNRDKVLEIAAEEGLDVAAMEERIASGVDLPRIQRDGEDLPEELRESGNPVLYINGRKVNGPLNAWNIRHNIQWALDDLEEEQSPSSSTS